MKIRHLLAAAALSAAPLSVATALPAGATARAPDAMVQPVRSPATLTLASGAPVGNRPAPPVLGQQLAAGKLGGARAVASNATLPRTGRGRPYRQAAFFVVLSALVGTACGVGRNVMSRRQS